MTLRDNKNIRSNGQNVDYFALVQDVLQHYKTSPIDILGIGDAEGEYAYLQAHCDSYIRTVRDIDALFGNARSGRKLLEIGSFLGSVSLSLKRLGYDVHALDIPEFHGSSALRAHYESHGIPFHGMNLRNSSIPGESRSFDAVVMCEVLEHLNFNPLPVLTEINRVLKTGGYFYIGMPNLAYLGSRIKLLIGRSINNPVEDFLAQLQRKRNMIVGLHWREYTQSEAIRLIEYAGFKSTKHYYYTERDIREKPLLKQVVSFLASTIPSFKRYQVIIGQKMDEPANDYWITEANS